MAYNIGDAFISVGADLDPMRRGFAEAEREARGLIGRLIPVFRGFNVLDSIFTGIFQGFGQRIFDILTSPVRRAVREISSEFRQIFEMMQDIEQRRVAWTFLVEGQRQADALLRIMQEITLVAPGTFQQVQQGFLTFAAVGHQIEDIPAFIEDINDAIAGLGGAEPEIQKAYAAFQNMIALQRVHAAQLNQLARAGVPAWKLAMEATGLTMDQLFTRLRAGGIDVEVFTRRFRDYAEANFAGAAAEQADTFRGALLALRDAFRIFMSTALGPLFELAGEGLAKMSQWIRRNQDVWLTWATQVAAVVSIVADGLRGFFSLVGQGFQSILRFFGIEIPNATGRAEDGVQRFDDVISDVGDSAGVTRDQLSGMERAVKAQERAVRDAERALRDEEQALRDQREALEDARRVTDSYREAVEALRDQLQAAQDEYDRFANARLEGEEEFRDREFALDQERARIERDLIDAEQREQERLEQVRQEIEAQEQVVEEYEDAVESARDAVERINDEIERQQDVIAEARDRVAEEREELGRLKEAYDDLRASISDAQGDLQKWANAPLVGTRRFREQLEDLDFQTSALQLKLLDLRIANPDADENARKMEERLLQIDEAAEEARLRLERLRDEQAAWGGDAPPELEAAIAEAQARYDALVGARDAAAVDAEEARKPVEEIEALEEEIQKLQQEAERTRLTEELELGPLRDQIEDLMDTAEEFTFDQIVNGIRDARDRVDELTAQLEPARQAWEDQQAAVDAAQEALEREEEALERIQDRREEANDAVEAANDALQVQQERLQAVRDRLQEVPPELERLRDALEKVGIEQDKLRLEEQLQLGPLREQLEDLKETADEMTFEEIRAGLLEWRNRISELEQELTDAEGALARQEEAQDAAAAAVDRASDALDRERQKIQEMRDAAQEARDALQELRDSIAEGGAGGGEEVIAGGIFDEEALGALLNPYVIALAALEEKFNETRQRILDWWNNLWIWDIGKIFSDPNWGTNLGEKMYRGLKWISDTIGKWYLDNKATLGAQFLIVLDGWGEWIVNNGPAFARELGKATGYFVKWLLEVMEAISKELWRLAQAFWQYADSPEGRQEFGRIGNAVGDMIWQGVIGFWEIVGPTDKRLGEAFTKWFQNAINVAVRETKQWIEETFGNILLWMTGFQQGTAEDKRRAEVEMLVRNPWINVRPELKKDVEALRKDIEAEHDLLDKNLTFAPNGKMPVMMRNILGAWNNLHWDLLGLRGLVIATEKGIVDTWGRIEKNLNDPSTGQVPKTTSGIWGAFDTWKASMIGPKGILTLTLEGMQKDWQNFYDWLLGKSMIPDIVNGITDWFDDLWDNLVGPKFGSVLRLTDDIEEDFELMGRTVVGFVKEMVGEWRDEESILGWTYHLWDVLTNPSGHLEKLHTDVVDIWEDLRADTWTKFKELTGVYETDQDGVLGWIGYIARKVEGLKDTIKEKILAPFTAVGAGIADVMKGIANGVIGAEDGNSGGLNAALLAFEKFANAPVSVVNWVAEKLKMSFRLDDYYDVPHIPRLAHGTDSFEGGFAVTGEEGSEIAILPKGPNLTLLPKGTKVIPHRGAGGLEEHLEVGGFHTKDTVVGAETVTNDPNEKHWWEGLLIGKEAIEWMFWGAERLFNHALQRTPFKDLPNWTASGEVPQSFAAGVKALAWPLAVSFLKDQVLQKVEEAWRAWGWEAIFPGKPGSGSSGFGEGEGPPPPHGRPVISPEGFVFPVEGYSGPVNYHWGSYTSGWPGASDIFGKYNAPILAIYPGNVIGVYADRGPKSGGHGVMMSHDFPGTGHILSYYTHFSRYPSVSSGRPVPAGTLLGYLGESGNAAGTGAHLHIGIGPYIQTGFGPKGGAGTWDREGEVPFDAVGLLRRIQGATRRQTGGWLMEPILGYGLDTGRPYTFVEDRVPEYVAPGPQAAKAARVSLGGVSGDVRAGVIIENLNIDLRGSNRTDAQVRAAARLGVSEALGAIGEKIDVTRRMR